MKTPKKAAEMTHIEKVAARAAHKTGKRCSADYARKVLSGGRSHNTLLAQEVLVSDMIIREQEEEIVYGKRKQ